MLAVGSSQLRQTFVAESFNKECLKWDSNPRLQGRLRPERSALDRSAIQTCRKYRMYPILNPLYSGPLRIRTPYKMACTLFSALHP